MHKLLGLVPVLLLTACDKPAATTPPASQPAPVTEPQAAGRTPQAAPPVPQAASPKPQAEPPPPQAATFTGVLLGDIAGIGGESTGWMLNQLDDNANVISATDVDVSKVQAQAEEHKGAKVRITGAVIEKDWVERGKTKIIVAEKIEEVP